MGCKSEVCGNDLILCCVGDVCGGECATKAERKVKGREAGSEKGLHESE